MDNASDYELEGSTLESWKDMVILTEGIGAINRKVLLSLRVQFPSEKVEFSIRMAYSGCDPISENVLPSGFSIKGNKDKI